MGHCCPRPRELADACCESIPGIWDRARRYWHDPETGPAESHHCRACSSSPDIFGIRMSAITHAARRCKSDSRNSSAEPKHRVTPAHDRGTFMQWLTFISAEAVSVQESDLDVLVADRVIRTGMEGAWE